MLAGWMWRTQAPNDRFRIADVRCGILNDELRWRPDGTRLGGSRFDPGPIRFLNVECDPNESGEAAFRVVRPGMREDRPDLVARLRTGVRSSALLPVHVGSDLRGEVRVAVATGAWTVVAETTYGRRAVGPWGDWSRDAQSNELVTVWKLRQPPTPLAPDVRIRFLDANRKGIGAPFYRGSAAVPADFDRLAAWTVIEARAFQWSKPVAVEFFPKPPAPRPIGSGDVSIRGVVTSQRSAFGWVGKTAFGLDGRPSSHPVPAGLMRPSRAFGPQPICWLDLRNTGGEARYLIEVEATDDPTGARTTEAISRSTVDFIDQEPRFLPIVRVRRPFYRVRTRRESHNWTTVATIPAPKAYASAEVVGQDRRVFTIGFGPGGVVVASLRDVDGAWRPACEPIALGPDASSVRIVSVRAGGREMASVSIPVSRMANDFVMLMRDPRGVIVPFAGSRFAVDARAFRVQVLRFGPPRDVVVRMPIGD